MRHVGVNDGSPASQGTYGVDSVVHADPAQRSALARYAAHRKAAKYGSDGTAAARSALEQKWAHEVDPDGTLPLGERKRRIASARKAYYSRLQYLSVRARKRKQT